MSLNRMRNLITAQSASQLALSSSVQDVRDYTGILNLTGNYTLTATDPMYVHCSSSTAMTCSLPAAGGLRATGEPLIYKIKDIGHHAGTATTNIRVSASTKLIDWLPAYIIDRNFGYISAQWNVSASAWFVMEQSGTSGSNVWPPT